MDNEKQNDYGELATQRSKEYVTIIQKQMDMFISKNLFKDFVFWKLHIITNSVLFKRSFLINKELFLSSIKRGQETEFFKVLMDNISKTFTGFCQILYFDK